MDGPQVKFDLKDLQATKHDDNGLKSLIHKELVELAFRHDLKVSFVADLADEVFDKIREQTAKFRTGRDPYPPSHVNMLAVQIVLPSVGKVGVTEWATRVVV